MPQVFAEKWFPSAVVWYSKLDNIDNNSIVDYVHSLMKESSGRVISNYGGWQSEERFLSEETDQEIKIIFENISECLTNIAKEYSYNRVPTITDYWINVNTDGNFNFPHTHGNAVISGVYYVKTPGDGKLRIYRPQEEQWLWNTFTNQSHPDTANYCEYAARESEVLMFPSWVSHMVTPFDQGERISIAFNAF
jgi:uncharacterized protein (TIGR02466 family)